MHDAIVYPLDAHRKASTSPDVGWRRGRIADHQAAQTLSSERDQLAPRAR